MGTPNGFMFLHEYGEEQIEQKVGVGVFEKTIGVRLMCGEGTSGQVWKRDAPVVVADYDTWEHRSPAFEYGMIGRVVGVPLKSGETFVGTLGLSYDPGTDQTFGDEEVDILTRFAELASLALDNARLFSETQDQVRRLAILNDWGREMSLAESMEEIVRLVTEMTPKIVTADRVSLAMLTETNDSLEVFAVQGESTALPVGKRLPLKGTIVGQAVLEKRLINTSDIQKSNASMHPSWRRRAFGRRSMYL